MHYGTRCRIDDLGKLARLIRLELQDRPDTAVGIVNNYVNRFTHAEDTSDNLTLTKVFDALEAGASDFETDGEVMTVYTGVDDVASVADALTEAGYHLLSAQVEMLPQNGTIKLTNEDDIKNMQKMLDMFEDNDDVQNVWHNWEDAE